jgi:hypothetical protein
MRVFDPVLEDICVSYPYKSINQLSAGKNHLVCGSNCHMMPSRRPIVHGFGLVFLNCIAGCVSSQPTTGVVAQKQIAVSVLRTARDPVDISLAVVSFESSGLVTGEHADIVPEIVNNASVSVSDAVHTRLAQRFQDIRYSANIVPGDESSPTNGLVSRDDFNTFTLGGTAVIDSTW